MTRRVAIIHPNVLVREGLSALLERYFSPVEVEKYQHVKQCAEHSEGLFDLYFTDGEEYALGSDFLAPRRAQCVLLTDRKALPSCPIQSLHITADTEQMIESLSDIMTRSGEASAVAPAAMSTEISAREAEVLTLVVSGAINKEIAARLHISLNTVLTHRKNITSKLGIKSISGLTLYALMNGYISTDKISTQ